MTRPFLSIGKHSHNSSGHARGEGTEDTELVNAVPNILVVDGCFWSVIKFGYVLPYFRDYAYSTYLLGGDRSWREFQVIISEILLAVYNELVFLLALDSTGLLTSS